MHLVTVHAGRAGAAGARRPHRRVDKPSSEGEQEVPYRLQRLHIDPQEGGRDVVAIDAVEHARDEAKEPNERGAKDEPNYYVACQIIHINALLI
mgnify:CR=1 FL=1